MSALEVLSQGLWKPLAWALLHFVWQGALVGLGLMLMLSLVRQATMRYTVSLAALLAMVVCPVATLLLLDTSTSVQAVAVDRTWQPAAIAPSTWSDVITAAAHIAQPYVVLSWMLGVVLLSLRLLVSYLCVRRLRSTATLLSAQRLPAIYRLAQRLRIKRRIQAAASDVVREAMVIGLWRPLVLLPAAWLTEMPAQTLEAILAHELAHVRRHDLWVNLLQRVVETLLFYHPAVWYVSRVLRVEREKCCDELAVAATGERLAYVEALELVAHRRLAASPSVWAAAMGGTKTMNLLERVRNVLGLRPATSAGQYWPVGIAALVLPLGLWCATAAFAPDDVKADDGDKPSPEAKAEGERREAVRREGDRPRAEGERERPRPEVSPRRDGERRPEGPRGGERRPEGPRDGERRPEGPRDGERRPEGLRDGERRPEGQPAVPPELVRIIRELRQEVQQLRREVNELREHRGPRPDGPRPDSPRREGDRPRVEGERERPRLDGDRPRPEGDRPRPEGNRPRPDAEKR